MSTMPDPHREISQSPTPPIQLEDGIPVVTIGRHIGADEVRSILEEGDSGGYKFVSTARSSDRGPMESRADVPGVDEP